MAVFALLFLLGIAPVMRGGNRHAAMIVLEASSLVFLVSVLAGTVSFRPRLSLRGVLLAVLLSSPLWLALVYLVPVPASLWAATPGRAAYPSALTSAGIDMADWLPLSLVPDVTRTSLFAGVPLVAAFLAGFWMRRSAVKTTLTALVVVAFVELLIGLLQAGSGSDSSLYFGRLSNRPLGTFANPNHFANYLSMALCAYVWLAWADMSGTRDGTPVPRRFGSERRFLVLWAAGGIILVVGILMSRSRGASLAGLFAAACSVALALASGRRRPSRRMIVLGVVAMLLIALSLVGFDLALSRFDPEDLRGSAAIRELLAATTMRGATEFWPWGAGWGTYEFVYPRFQPASIVGIAGYAHHDYAQILFEGGVFGVVLLAVVGWLCAARAVELVRNARRRGRLRREEMAPAICGLGLLGFLLHSFVEFNMHIPANAIAASLLAGVYLRPLKEEDEANGD